MAKLAKSAVDFEHPAKGKDRCASCKHFLRGNRCAIVVGVVEPQDWCKRYEGKVMAKLTAATRNALPSSTFAGPGRSYPIPDASHARASQFASSGLKSKIRRKVAAKFPSIKLSSMARAQ